MFACVSDDPQPFWPSIMMKKWLNIKPQVNDFSEDEVDTESEDDGMNEMMPRCRLHVSFLATRSFLSVSNVTVVSFCSLLM